MQTGIAKEDKMTPASALLRARKAVQKACSDSDSFAHGDMASMEIVSVIFEALEAEFSKPTK